MFIESTPNSRSESPSQIDECIAFWAERGVVLSIEDARSAIKAVKTLFSLLDTWDQKDRMNNAPEFSDRGDF